MKPVDANISMYIDFNKENFKFLNLKLLEY